MNRVLNEVWEWTTLVVWRKSTGSRGNSSKCRDSSLGHRCSVRDLERRPAWQEQNGQAREWSKLRPEGDTCMQRGEFNSEIRNHWENISIEMTWSESFKKIILATVWRIDFSFGSCYLWTAVVLSLQLILGFRGPCFNAKGNRGTSSLCRQVMLVMNFVVVRCWEDNWLVTQEWSKHMDSFQGDRQFRIHW